MKLLITGATGLIGTVLSRQLPQMGDYEISGIDARTMTRQSENEDNAIVRFTLADCHEYDAIETAFRDQDAVVHLAANAPVNTPWQDVLRNNIAATHNVYEAAKANGVRRIVFASSNHAVGNFELDAPYRDIVRGDYSSVQNSPSNIPIVDHNVPIRPDSDYGVSKVFGEATGRYYSEHFGLEVACLRIGTVNPQDRPPNIRGLATWLSHRDLAQLVHRSLQMPLKFEIFYGVSNNKWRFWDIRHAHDVIGYQPIDNAEKYRTE